MITDMDPVRMPRFGSRSNQPRLPGWKVTVGAAVLLALVPVLVIARGPGKPPPKVVEPQQQVTAKTDREQTMIVEKTVRTIPIVVAKAPPSPKEEVAQAVELPEQEYSAPRETPSYRRKTPEIRKTGGDVCARVGWKKVITRGGKSWRCRRR
jgi:hypothetical protein